MLVKTIFTKKSTSNTRKNTWLKQTIHNQSSPQKKIEIGISKKEIRLIIDRIHKLGLLYHKPEINKIFLEPY